MKKKILSLLLCAVLLLCSCTEEKNSSEAGSDTENQHLDTEVAAMYVNIYCNTVALSGQKLYSINGNKTVPYVNQGILKILLNGIFGDNCYKGQGNDGTVIQNAVNGSTLTIEKDENRLVFDDYERFFDTTNNENPMNNSFVSTLGKICKITSDSYTNPGKTVIDLDDYGITTYRRKNNYYIPFATVCNIIPSLNMLVFNGSNVFCCANEYPCYDENYNLNEYGGFFKGNIQIDFDEELRQFTYNNLCLCIDLNYALKADKGFESADEFLSQKGVKEIIFSGKPSVEVFEGQLDVIFNDLLDDRGHTGIGITETSFFNKSTFDNVISTDGYSAREAEGERLMTLRGETLPYYLHNEKTLVITIDRFSDAALNSDDCQNVIFELNEKLNNDAGYSGVENVIIDLSCNQGGNDSGAVLLGGWITGEGRESLISARSGAKSEITALIDINGDGAYDEKDSIRDKSVYIIVSSYTYSAAAVLANNLKGSENVTLVGEKTAGGMCNSIGFATVIGNSFRMSSRYRALPTEGESGIEPDIMISEREMASVYNPDWLLSHKK